jgi:parvulin-like peptidyl-prolyl isomerase
MPRILKEPLLHFFLLGAVIFLLGAVWGRRDTDPAVRIEISAAEIEHLRKLWTRTWQRSPTPEELRGAVEARVREEVLYREALAMGLAQDDTAVRRRLVQKLEFLQEDASKSADIDPKELERHYAQHAAAYAEPERVSFSQVYFSVDRHGAQAEAMARAALEKLDGEGKGAEAGAGLGDPIALEQAYGALTPQDVAQVFGPEFAEALSSIVPGRWQGPVPSGFGLHLVYVVERLPGRTRALDEVREAVVRDYQRSRREAAAKAYYERLRRRYEIVIDASAIDASALARTTK